MSNKARSGGGLDLWQSSLLIFDTKIEGNSAVWGGGGGLYSEYSTIKITNSELRSNSAEYGGGGLWAGKGTRLVITGSNIDDNMITDRGADIYCKGEEWNPARTNVTVINSNVDDVYTDEYCTVITD